MKVITLAKTKELLGIATTTSDAAITAKIPYIDSIVKQITNNRFNYAIYGSLTTGSNEVYISSIESNTGDRYYYDKNVSRFFCSGINNSFCLDDLGDYLQIGQQLEGTGIPADAFIDEVYYNGYIDSSGENIPYIKMSAVATEDVDFGQIYLGMNISYQPIIAKGIQYLINGTSTSLPSNSLSSKSIGVVSKSYSASDQKIDNKYGMPAWFVKSFPRYQVAY